MDKKEKERESIHRIVVGGLREAINTHGPITRVLIGSAAKRITGKLIRKTKQNDKKKN